MVKDFKKAIEQVTKLRIKGVSVKAVERKRFTASQKARLKIMKEELKGVNKNK